MRLSNRHFWWVVNRVYSCCLGGRYCTYFIMYFARSNMHIVQVILLQYICICRRVNGLYLTACCCTIRFSYRRFPARIRPINWSRVFPNMCATPSLTWVSAVLVALSSAHVLLQVSSVMYELVYLLLKVELYADSGIAVLSIATADDVETLTNVCCLHGVLRLSRLL